MVDYYGSIDNVKSLLGLQPIPLKESFEGDGERTVFHLSFFPFQSERVYVAGELLTSGYSCDYENGKIVFDVAPSSDDMIIVEYEYVPVTDAMIEKLLKLTKREVDVIAGRPFGEAITYVEKHSISWSYQAVTLGHRPVQKVNWVKVNGEETLSFYEYDVYENVGVIEFFFNLKERNVRFVEVSYVVSDDIPSEAKILNEYMTVKIILEEILDKMRAVRMEGLTATFQTLSQRLNEIARKVEEHKNYLKAIPW